MLSSLSRFIVIHSLMLVFLSSPSAVWGDDQRLLGRWQTQLAEQIIALEIVSNNQLVLDGVPAYYRQFPGVIRMRGDYVTVDYPYQFEDQVLRITFPEGYQLRFAKEGDIATTGRERIAASQSGAIDHQLRELLLSSAWCTFSFRGGSAHPEAMRGAKRLLRLKFYPDGSYMKNSRSRAYSSAYGAAMAGQVGSSSSGHWRVQDGRLFAAEGGGAMQPVPLDISFDPGGAPILYFSGTEYRRCD
jgi:hypothetical protein